MILLQHFNKFLSTILGYRGKVLLDVLKLQFSQAHEVADVQGYVAI